MIFCRQFHDTSVEIGHGPWVSQSNFSRICVVVLQCVRECAQAGYLASYVVVVVAVGQIISNGVPHHGLGWQPPRLRRLRRRRSHTKYLISAVEQALKYQLYTELRHRDWTEDHRWFASADQNSCRRRWQSHTTTSSSSGHSTLVASWCEASSLSAGERKRWRHVLATVSFELNAFTCGWTCNG